MELVGSVCLPSLGVLAHCLQLGDDAKLALSPTCGIAERPGLVLNWLLRDTQNISLGDLVEFY